MEIRELLAQKARPVHTIDADQTIESAVEKMTAEQTGALIVMEDDRPVGIFAERDVMRAYLTDRTMDFMGRPVREAMTNRLITADVTDEVTPAVITMLKARIRHLPVFDGIPLVGMLAIEDMVDYLLQALNLELRELREYISDLHDASHD